MGALRDEPIVAVEFVQTDVAFRRPLFYDVALLWL